MPNCIRFSPKLDWKVWNAFVIHAIVFDWAAPHFGGRQIGNTLLKCSNIMQNVHDATDNDRQWQQQRGGSGSEREWGRGGRTCHTDQRRNQKSLAVGTRQLAHHWHVCDTQTHTHAHTHTHTHTEKAWQGRGLGQAASVASVKAFSPLHCREMEHFMLQ